jgi:excisionase family DNA binding protein
MNLKTAAAKLSVHYQTAYKLVRSGSLAAVKIGGTYEISEAALERYRAEREALRSAACELRQPIGWATRDIESGLEEVRTVARSTTTTPRGLYDTVAKVAAECIGDLCTVRARNGDGFEVVAFHDTDPKRRAALAAIIDGYGFGDTGPGGTVAQARASQQTVLVPHVPQDHVRRSIDPQHRQFLDDAGVHSLIAAPAVVDGVVEAVVVLNRAAPGAPYGDEHVAIADALVRALEVGLRRTAAYRAGWERRCAIVQAVRRHVRNGDAGIPVEGLLHDDGFAEVVYDFGQVVHANLATTGFVGGDARALVGHFTDEGKPAAGDRLYDGDLEFHDEERDVQLSNGEARRLILHRGLVRDAAAEPRALVVVAQPVPLAS